jgi:hypothetical protein
MPGELIGSEEAAPDDLSSAAEISLDEVEV